MSKVAVFIQRGDIIDYLNGSEADLAAGDVVVIGERIGVCEANISAGVTGAVKIVGIWKMPAIATAGFDAGEKLFWDAEAETLTNTVAPTAGVPEHDESNTGDADISEVVVTPGDLAIAETWTLECITEAVKALVAGAPAADSGNTGKADVTGATVTLGDNAVKETWKLTCIDAETPTAEVWSVIGSKTGRIADLTTGVAFVSDFINVTIPAGDGSGTAHWVADDFITIGVTSTGAKASEAVFEVYGSVTGMMDQLVAGAAYDNGYIALTLPVASGGETVWTVADKVTVAVSIANIVAGICMAAKISAGTEAYVKINA